MINTYKSQKGANDELMYNYSTTSYYATTQCQRLYTTF